jgi:transcriptional regulator with XRE-family HTH domain
VAKIDALEVFGARIRELRTQRGYSQEKLAELAGLHRNYVGDVERGVRNVGLLNVLHLAKALNVLPVALLTRFDQRMMRDLPSPVEKPSRRSEK